MHEMLRVLADNAIAVCGSMFLLVLAFGVFSAWFVFVRTSDIDQISQRK